MSARRAPLVTVAFVFLIGAVPAASASGAGFEFEADCVEATIFLPLDPQRVRDEVPGIASYTMSGEDTGTVLGVVGHGSCTGLRIDGSPAGEFAFSEAGVAVDSPDGTFGSHAYMFWVLWDHSGLHQRGCELGACWPVTKLPFGLTSSPTAPAVRTLEASTAWGPSRSSISATIVDAPAAGVGNHGVTAWIEGRHGTVRNPFVITGEVDTSGPGVLRAEPDSKLARILGEEQVEVEVFLRRFHFRASPALAG